MSNLQIQLVHLMQHAACPDEHFKPVSNVPAARKYPGSLTQQALINLSALMDTNVGLLLLNIPGHEVSPVSGPRGQTKVLENTDRFQQISPGFLKNFDKRTEFFDIIKELYSLQDNINVFMQANLTIIQNIFAIGEIIIANNSFLRKIIEDHLFLGKLLIQNAITLSTKTCNTLKTETSVDESKRFLTQESIEGITKKVQEIFEMTKRLSARVNSKLDEAQKPGYVRHMLLQLLEVTLQEAQILVRISPQYDGNRISAIENCKLNVNSCQLGAFLNVADDGVISIRQPESVSSISEKEFLDGKLVESSSPRSVQDTETLAGPTFPQQQNSTEVSPLLSDLDQRSVRSSSLSSVKGSVTPPIIVAPQQQNSTDTRSLSGGSKKSVRWSDDASTQSDCPSRRWSSSGTSVATERSLQEHLYDILSTQKGVLQTIQDSMGKNPNGHARNKRAKLALGEFVGAINSQYRLEITQDDLSSLSAEQLWGIQMRLLNISFINYKFRHLRII